MLASQPLDRFARGRRSPPCGGVKAVEIEPEEPGCTVGTDPSFRSRSQPTKFSTSALRHIQVGKRRKPRRASSASVSSGARVRSDSPGMHRANLPRPRLPGTLSPQSVAALSPRAPGRSRASRAKPRQAGPHPHRRSGQAGRRSHRQSHSVAAPHAEVFVRDSRSTITSSSETWEKSRYHCPTP